MKTKGLLLILGLFFISETCLGEHIVRFENGVPPDFAARVKVLGGTIVTQHRVIAVISGLSDAAAASLGASGGGIAEVRPDVQFRLDDRTAGIQPATVVHPNQTSPTTAYFYARQWHHRAIGADVAWAAGRLGSPGVTVAIIDTGIDYTYYDLNGLVDLSRSVSFVPSDDALVALYFPTRHPVTDLHYHGTHVASTVSSKAAVVAGVTSNVTLFGVKVLSVDGVGSLSAVLNGVLWAADHGADVANMSLGGGFSKIASGEYVGMINAVFNYGKARGTLYVVSAGNSAMDLDHNGNLMITFCDAANVLCVAATGPTSEASVDGPWFNIDTPSTYTNYGRSAIRVAAPGGNYDSFVWQACSQTSLVIPICQTGIYALGAQGTSMAAPHVTGLAALVVEAIGKKQPGQVRTRIQRGADDLGPVGTDPFYGKGRINVPKTLGIQEAKGPR